MNISRRMQRGDSTPEESFSPGLELDLPKNIIPVKKRPKIEQEPETSFGTVNDRFSNKNLTHPNSPLKSMRARAPMTPFALYHLIMCVREAGRRLAMSDTTIARACTLVHRASCVLITGSDPTNPCSGKITNDLEYCSEYDVDPNDSGMRREATMEAINDSFQQSFVKIDPHTIAMACLNLAGKVQEDYQRMRDVILAYHRTLHQNEPAGKAGPLESPEEYDRLRESLVQCELLLMRLLSFDVKQPLLPHPYLLHYISALLHWIGKGVPFDKTSETKSSSKSLALARLPGLAWGILADSYHTTICLQFLPQHVAAAILHLSLRIAGLEVPGNRHSEMAWWQAICNSLSREIVEQIQLKVMNVYSIDDTMPASSSVNRVSASAGRRFE